jgi:hypothetical protein
LLRVDASLFLDSESFIQVIESFARVIASFMDLGVSLLLVGVPFVRGGVTFAGAASRVPPGDASSRPSGAPFHLSDGASRTTNGPSSALDERFPYAARRSGSSTATAGVRALSRGGGNGTRACGEGGGATLAAIAGCCDRTNPNAERAEEVMGHSPAGLFGYSHLTGGYPGGPDTDAVVVTTRGRLTARAPDGFSGFLAKLAAESPGPRG